MKMLRKCIENWLEHNLVDSRVEIQSAFYVIFCCCCSCFLGGFFLGSAAFFLFLQKESNKKNQQLYLFTEMELKTATKSEFFNRKTQSITSENNFLMSRDGCQAVFSTVFFNKAFSVTKLDISAQNISSFWLLLEEWSF